MSKDIGSAKRRQNYIVAVALRLIGTTTWLAGSGGGGCISGACLLPLLTNATLAAAPVLTGNGDVPSDESKSIAAAVEGFHDALRRGDSTAALELLAPDAIILESGATQTREQYAREHLAEDIAFVKAVPETRSNISVKQQGDAAWETAITRSIGTFNGHEVNSVGVELMVLTKVDSQWRICAVHWSSHKAMTTESASPSPSDNQR